MKQYCLNCGNPTQYFGSPPKFCSECGGSFNGASVAKPRSAIRLAHGAEPGDKEIPETGIPSVDSLDVEIAAGRPRTTLGRLAFQPKSSESFKRPRPPRITKKKFMEQWSKEAGFGAQRISENVGGEE